VILAKSPEILTLKFPGPKTENHTFGAQAGDRHRQKPKPRLVAEGL